MAKGFDCATPLTAAKAREFATDGFTFACRYLAPVGSRKRLTEAEARGITDAGMWIVSVFERGAANALAGAAQGAEDGKLALQYAREVGQPEGSVIYAAVDTDVNPSHYDAVEAYLRAFDAEISGYKLGVYGEYEICKAMHDRGVVSKVWQTYAWSRGQKVDDPNVYQYENDVTENGIGIDRDESNGDAGGWKLGMLIQKQGLDAGVAQTIIETWIKPDWQGAEEAKTGASPESIQALAKQQVYYNWLANRLREAAGLPQE